MKIDLNIDMTMHPGAPEGRLVRDHVLRPTFLITAEPNKVGTPLAITFTVETFGCDTALSDVEELGNLLEVLGKEIQRTAPAVWARSEANQAMTG